MRLGRFNLQNLKHSILCFIKAVRKATSWFSLSLELLNPPPNLRQNILLAHILGHIDYDRIGLILLYGIHLLADNLRS